MFKYTKLLKKRRCIKLMTHFNYYDFDTNVSGYFNKRGAYALFVL